RHLWRQSQPGESLPVNRPPGDGCAAHIIVAVMVTIPPAGAASDDLSRRIKIQRSVAGQRRPALRPAQEGSKPSSNTTSASRESAGESVRYRTYLHTYR